MSTVPAPAVVGKPTGQRDRVSPTSPGSSRREALEDAFWSIRNRSEANEKLIDIYNTMTALSDQITDFVQSEYVFHIVHDLVAAGLMGPTKAAEEYDEHGELFGDLVCIERDLDGFQRILDLLAGLIDSSTVNPKDNTVEPTAVAVEGGAA